MNCPNCATPAEPGRKFCGECGTSLVQACPTCATPAEPGRKFCGECGTQLPAGNGTADGAAIAGGALAAETASSSATGTSKALSASVRPAPPPETVAERRIVSVLFADLVGFTTLSEGRDAEETRELLTRYFDLARDTIERYGGVVEKFIGDAVMAVWGAPTAHEDDAERSVRAALELVEAIPGALDGVQARAGILTGEAAVTLGATNQGMVAGDLVNTASRLQAAATPGTVLVGEATQRAAAGAVAFEAAGKTTLKGKAAPVAAWRALRVVAQRRGIGRVDRLEAPFVGRESELRLMKDLFHATSRERRVRLVSITGVAGIGKSRLAWEFLKYVDGVVEPVLWHEGRSPSYGDGVTFWALGEMVRTRAKLVETDDDETTRTRVAEMLATYVPDADERKRIEPALHALLGIGEAPPGGAEALFGAWRTFFERLAADQVVALVFEDLHWADPGTLDFIDHVLEWSRNVPILIITLARPELLEQRPGWGAGRRNFLALDVDPLPEAAMRELLVGLVPGLPDAAIRTIVGRADGIPLYAVETIRMLLSDGRLTEQDDGTFVPAGDLGELAVPETLHALIAARLDALDQADRSLIQDASVLGQSFNVDDLVAVAGAARDVVGDQLRRLVRLEILRQEVDPRSPERGQHAFVQALIREVAYGTLSLRDRRERHLAAARYFERLDDAELVGALAAHYVSAWRAFPTGDEGNAVAAQARVALMAAATRAAALGSPRQAMSFYEQALEVTTGDADRADLLERAGDAADTAGRPDLAEEILAEAAELLERTGDVRAHARVVGRRAKALGHGRRRDEAVALLEPLVDGLGELADDPVGIDLLSTLAAMLSLTQRYDESGAYADRALAAAERQGLAEIAADAMYAKGVNATFQGRQWEARTLIEGARRLALEYDLARLALTTSVALANLAGLDDVRHAVELDREALALARRRGERAVEVLAVGNGAEDARRTGEWDWASTEIEAALQLDIDEATRSMLRLQRKLFDLLRGRPTSDDLAALASQVATLQDHDVAAGAHDVEATAALTEGRYLDAHDLWMRIVGLSDLNTPYVLPRAALAAVLGGDVEKARNALDVLDARGARGRALDADRMAIRAGIAALEGDAAAAVAGYRSAIGAWRDLGLPWDEALTGLAAAIRVGIAVPAVADWVESARSIFVSLGAEPMLALLDHAVATGPSPSNGGRKAADPARKQGPRTDQAGDVEVARIAPAP